MRSTACCCLWFAVLAFAAGTTTISFEDAAPNAGIRFVLQNKPTPQKQLPETMAGGLAAFDFNNDGRTDLFLTGGAGAPALYRNDGQFRFTDVTSEAGFGRTGYSIGAAAADFDNDGLVDLFVAGVRECHLYRNMGGGKFEDVSRAAGIACPEWAVAAAWLDYDRDGLLDLFIVNYLDYPAANPPVCHDPSGRYTVYCNPRQFKGSANRLFRNYGGGRFEDVSMASGIARVTGKGMSVGVADYDRDGWPDLYVTNDTEPNFLFHNLRNGRFEEVALDAGAALPDDGKPVSAMGVDFRDYDNDGLPDLVYTALTGETFPLFRNTGDGHLRDQTYASRLGRLTARLAGWGVGLVDLDNDGWKDLFTANAHVSDNIDLFSGDRYQLPNSVFSNRHGVFGPAIEFGPPRAHRGAVVTDLDGDGRPDIVVAVLGERPEVWRNTAADLNHWIDIRLAGSKGNRDGIGAVIYIGQQWNHETSATGYASSVLAPVHFGLGAQTTIPLIDIEWPSGKQQELRNVKPDRVLTVREPN
ncbi:MAG TPA: CRTAC1 family protein [Bryobacteraceae bacterium]|nr:CRTAC1 family protein [Bryobacteraceae bacterium]